jgi:acyl-coenzyme A thioesterase PaaI-like protein
VAKSASLLSLNAVFLGPATGPRLLAEAHAERRGGVVHVNLRINQPHAKGETVASAQAIYALSQPDAASAQGAAL